MIKTKYNAKTKFWEKETINRKVIQNNFYKHFLDDKEKIKGKENSKIKRIKNNTIHLVQLDKYLVLEKINYLLDFYKNVNKDIFNQYIRIQITISKPIKQHYKNLINIKLPNDIHNIEISKILIIVENEEMSLDKEYKNIKFIKLDYFLDKKNIDKIKLFFKKNEFIFCQNEKIINILNKRFFSYLGKYQIPLIPLENEFNIDYIKKYIKGTYFKLNLAQMFSIKVASIKQTKKEIVKNIIHGFYNAISEILSKSEKYTSLLKVSIFMKGSVLFDVYKNENIK